MPEFFNYTSRIASVKIKLPLRFRIKAWFWRRRPEIRTLRGENFHVKVDAWWKPSERKAARVTLALLDSDAEEIRRAVQKKLERAFLFGTGYEKKTWEK